MVKAIAGLIQKLQTHNSVILNTPHGPISWSALWAYPAPEGGKASNLPVLVELPDMHEEQIDVEEACDAGLVDREDLVNEKGALDCICPIPRPPNEQTAFHVYMPRHTLSMSCPSCTCLGPVYQCSGGLSLHRCINLCCRWSQCCQW